MVRGDLVRISKQKGYPSQLENGKIGIIMSHDPGDHARIFESGQELFWVMVDGQARFEYKCNLESVNAQD